MIIYRINLCHCLPKHCDHNVRLAEWKTTDNHPLRVRPGLRYSVRILTIEHDLTTLNQQVGVKKGGLCLMSTKPK